MDARDELKVQIFSLNTAVDAKNSMAIQTNTKLRLFQEGGSLQIEMSASYTQQGHKLIDTHAQSTFCKFIHSKKKASPSTPLPQGLIVSYKVALSFCFCVFETGSQVV